MFEFLTQLDVIIIKCYSTLALPAQIKPKQPGKNNVEEALSIQVES